MSVKYRKTFVYGLIPPPRLMTTRFLSGHGTEKGGIVTRIRNHGDKTVTVVFLDIIPWFLRVYLHTLQVKIYQVFKDHKSHIHWFQINVNGEKVKPIRLDFVPGVDRQKPYSLELVLAIPSKSSLEISIEFEKSILKWLEYPPDANKGFYVNSALITTILDDKSNFTGIPR